MSEHVARERQTRNDAKVILGTNRPINAYSNSMAHFLLGLFSQEHLGDRNDAEDVIINTSCLWRTLFKGRLISEV